MSRFDRTKWYTIDEKEFIAFVNSDTSDLSVPTNAGSSFDNAIPDINTDNKPYVIIEGYPLWLPIDAWQGWVEMRKQRKRPLTDRAKARALTKLEALHLAGHDINELLDRSTINGWLDIYEPKGTTNAGNSKHAAEPTNPMVRAVLASQARRATDGERHSDDWA
jgi:hypothetical protein